VTDMDWMFYKCSSLTTVSVGDGWDMTRVQRCESMFYQCYNIIGELGTTYDSGYDGEDAAHVDRADYPGYFVSADYLTVPYALLSADKKTLTLYHDGQRGTHRTQKTYSINMADNEEPGWYQDESMYDITQVVIDPSFADARPTSTYYWFGHMNVLNGITGMEYLNTSEVTNMAGMFEECNVLTSLDVSHFDTKKVKNMADMFEGCNELTALDVSGFDTRNVTNMYGMFATCSSLTAIDVRNFDTQKVTNMGSMFFGCNSLTSLDVSFLNTSNVTNMGYMFGNCENLTNLDLRNYNTAKVTDMSHMFHGCTNMRTICVGDGWSTANVTQSGYMFTSCTNLVGGAGTVFDKNHVDAEYAHIDGGQTNPGYFVDYSFNDTPYALLSADGTTLTFYKDSQRLTRSERTYNLNTDKQVPGWLGNNGNSNITTVVFDPSFADVRPTTTYKWFYMVYFLNNITGLENLNTSEVTDMSYMFGSTDLENLDLSTFDTQNVADMSYMFGDNNVLTSVNVSCFDTQTVMYMEGMFYECSALTALDLSSFNTQNVKSFKDMFFDCVGLTSLDLSHFDTQNAETMNGMFIDCTGLTNLNLSGFNTEHVDDMNSMFSGCSSLTKLDLSDFDTSSLLTAEFMFFNCTNLQTIYVGNGWDMSDVEESAGMFFFCSSIVGGMGTTYDANHVDKTYAHIDGGEGNPGYFTEKPTFIPGDANGDGVVSIADVTAVIGYILGQPVANFKAEAANVDGIEGITIEDAKAIVNMILQ
jgi:surface protein